MKCNQDCEQGRRCACTEDLYAMDVWMVWAICLSLSVISLSVVVALIAFLWGMLK